MLEYLFTIQKTVRLPTGKAGLLVTPDHSIHGRRLPTSCPMPILPVLEMALPPGSHAQSEAKHAKVQHKTLQCLTFWHPDSLVQVEILALNYTRFIHVGMGFSGWHGQEAGVVQKCLMVFCLSKYTAFQQDVLIQAQQCTHVTYTAAGSQLALIWPA